VDAELGAHNINASKIEGAINPIRMAIELVHALGNPYNLEVITDLC